MPGKKGSSWDATEQELGPDGFAISPSRRVTRSAGFEDDPEDEPKDDDLDEDEFDDEDLEDEDFDDDDLDDEDDDDDEEDDLDDDLIDLDDEFDEPEEDVRPQHPGRYEE
jgi:hypothetical protein